jgi:uncharacterized protein YbjQ (UPF0145 family)
MANCAGCGAKQGLLSAINALGGDWVCDSCLAKREAEKSGRDQRLREAAEANRARIAQSSKLVLLTTTPHVDGHTVVKYLGIESVEYVIGTGLFSEMTTEVYDFFGARSGAFEKKLQAAKQYAVDALKHRAAEKGANAVIGVDMDYTEFSNNRVALILNGTLVVIERYGS